MKEKIVLYGGGGHCKVIISILKKLNRFLIDGIIDDDKSKINQSILGIKIKYTSDDLTDIYNSGIKNIFISFGSLGYPKLRIKTYHRVKKIGFNLPVIISNEALINEEVYIDEGTVIMPGVIINPGTEIGKNCIINSGAIIEHDNLIGNFAHIASGAVLSGTVKIGENSHIGTGTTIIQNISIGENCIIGAGSVVVRDVDDKKVVYGVPAKFKRYQEVDYEG